MNEVKNKAQLAKEASFILSSLTTQQKNDALAKIADALISRQDDILEANAQDIKNGKIKGTTASLLDRLTLTTARIIDMANGLREIISLPDPIGTTIDDFTRPNGLHIKKIRVPLGVIGMIYEARPNVTVDAAGLCLKTGNAVVLRGGSAALFTNKQIINVLHDALEQSEIPKQAIQLIENADRSSVNEMLTLNGLLDVIIPRGGSSLIQNVVKNATVPVIETGAGICHTFIDASADSNMAKAIAINAKVQRPSVCNSMETLLIHQTFAEKHLESIAQKLLENHVEIRGCHQTFEKLPWIKHATDDDFATEYNDYILNIKIVSDLDEALAHIRQYSTQHSECIVTENQQNANRFIQLVDAAAVYHNASTRFTDGYEFGLGAEIGISTQKLHARGPMGLDVLTSTKYCIYGNGQIRN